MGDESLRHYEGSAALTFEAVPNVENDQYVKVLGQIDVNEGKVIIKGRSIYQQIHR